MAAGAGQVGAAAQADQPLKAHLLGQIGGQVTAGKLLGDGAQLFQGEVELHVGEIVLEHRINLTLVAVLQQGLFEGQQLQPVVGGQLAGPQVVAGADPDNGGLVAPQGLRLDLPDALVQRLNHGVAAGIGVVTLHRLAGQTLNHAVVVGDDHIQLARPAPALVVGHQHSLLLIQLRHRHAQKVAVVLLHQLGQPVLLQHLNQGHVLPQKINADAGGVVVLPPEQQTQQNAVGVDEVMTDAVLYGVGGRVHLPQGGQRDDAADQKGVEPGFLCQKDLLKLRQGLILKIGDMVALPRIPQYIFTVVEKMFLQQKRNFLVHNTTEGPGGPTPSSLFFPYFKRRRRGFQPSFAGKAGRIGTKISKKFIFAYRTVYKYHLH